MPVGADEDLKPESLDQSVEKYNGFKKSKDIDPMNHEIWKLYIFYDLTPTSGYDKTPKWLVAGLSPDRRYKVVLEINQLYNFLSSRPQPGDVVVVEGHITSHYDMSVTTEYRQYTVPAFLMYAEGAVNLPRERFDPTVRRIITPTTQLSATPTPGGSRH